jgi:2-hydroxy-3-oxopropionate reductase
MGQLGFIGLGIMGRPMAGHLLAAGNTVYVYDRVADFVKEAVSMGAVACNNSREVAEKSDIIIVMVPDTPDVESVLFGENGVVEGVKKGSIVVDMSSISPIATKDFAARLADIGVEMLDAPVSGGQVGAEKAILSIMVGGKGEVFDKIKPYFDLMGKNVVLIGDNGAGQTCKVANQIAVAVTIAATAEALTFASKAGADPVKVREALMGGLAGSRIMGLLGDRMIKRTFQPGFRVRLHQKDLNLALQSARSLQMSIPSTALAQEMFNAVAGRDGIDLDHSAMVLAFEALADHSVAGEKVTFGAAQVTPTGHSGRAPSAPAVDLQGCVVPRSPEQYPLAGFHRRAAASRQSVIPKWLKLERLQSTFGIRGDVRDCSSRPGHLTAVPLAEPGRTHSESCRSCEPAPSRLYPFLCIGSRSRGPQIHVATPSNWASTERSRLRTS